MQQQASPAPALVPTMPQLPTTQPTATMPRDPMEYTQANFPTLTPRQLAVLAQLEMQDQQALRSSAHNVLQPSLQTMAGRPAQSMGSGHTQPASTTSRLLETHNSVLHRSHTQHHEGRDRRAGATRGHSIEAIADPETTAGTADHAAMERAGPIGADPGPPGPDPQADQAFVLRSRSQLGKLPVPDLRLTEEWMTKWSYRAPPPQHTGAREGAAATDGDKSTFCLLHGLDLGGRSSTATTSIPSEAIQLYSGP